MPTNVQLRAEQYRKELAQRYHEQPQRYLETGVVVLYRGEPQSWVNRLRDPQSWCPGCIAIAADGTCYRAIGGDDYNGATGWERLT